MESKNGDLEKQGQKILNGIKLALKGEFTPQEYNTRVDPLQLDTWDGTTMILKGGDEANRFWLTVWRINFLTMQLQAHSGNPDAQIRLFPPEKEDTREHKARQDQPIP